MSSNLSFAWCQFPQRQFVLSCLAFLFGLSLSLYGLGYVALFFALSFSIIPYLTAKGSNTTLSISTIICLCWLPNLLLAGFFYAQYRQGANKTNDISAWIGKGNVVIEGEVSSLKTCANKSTAHIYHHHQIILDATAVRSVQAKEFQSCSGQVAISIYSRNPNPRCSLGESPVSNYKAVFRSARLQSSTKPFNQPALRDFSRNEFPSYSTLHIHDHIFAIVCLEKSYQSNQLPFLSSKSVNQGTSCQAKASLRQLIIKKIPLKFDPQKKQAIPWGTERFVSIVWQTYQNCQKILQQGWEYAQTIANTWRQKIVSFHASVLGEKQGKLLVSIVIGEAAVTLSKDTVEEFRNVGLSPVLAASGFNLSIVILTSYFVLFIFGRSRLLGVLGALIGILVFVFLAGLEPSVTRAALMGILFCLGKAQLRHIHLPASLCFAAVISSLIDPPVLINIGFQLSYVATVGLVVGGHFFSYIINKQISKWFAWLVNIIAATLLAQSAVLPLQLWYFWEMSPYVLVANVAVIPVVSFITYVGFLSTVLYLVSKYLTVAGSIAVLLDNISNLPLAWVSWIVSTLAKAPSSHIVFGCPPLQTVFGYYIYLCLFVIFRTKKIAYFIFLPGLLFCLIALFWRCPLEQPVHLKVSGCKIYIDENRKAYCIGNKNAPTVQRVLKYYSAKLTTTKF